MLAFLIYLCIYLFFTKYFLYNNRSVPTPTPLLFHVTSKSKKKKPHKQVFKKISLKKINVQSSQTSTGATDSKPDMQILKLHLKMAEEKNKIKTFVL